MADERQGSKDGALRKVAKAPRASAEKSGYEREFLRAENEDDDGYDPYSDRRPEPEPLFEENPWG